MDAAYRSTHTEVTAAWEETLAEVNRVKAGRDALAERLGRNIMVNRSGFGHSTRVVGVERLDTDKPGDLLADGALKVLKTERYSVTPNARTKAGKDLRAEMAALTSPGFDLPGMPSFHLGSIEDQPGLRSMAPALWADKVRSPRGFKTVYALWPSADAPVDLTYWESIPLSVYYAAKEKHDD